MRKIIQEKRPFGTRHALTFVEILILTFLVVGGAWATKIWFFPNGFASKQPAKSEQSTTAAPTQPVASQPIVIKGLYIGMPAADVPAAVAQKFGSGGWSVQKMEGVFWITTPALKKYEQMMDSSGATLPYKTYSNIYVSFDRNGTVSAIRIGHDPSDELFHSGLSGDDFYKMMCDAYHLPKMSRTGKGGWSGKTDDNVIIEISDYREVSIYRGANLNALQGNFN